MQKTMKKMLAAAILGAGLVTGAAADWRYQTDVDQMTSKKVFYATLESNNSLSLNFPYQGTNYGHLVVRRHPKHGLTVLVRVDKGQILCRSYATCDVSIRFDDAQPMTFSGVEPADNSSDRFFLNNERRFLDRAKKAKRILVQVNMYQAGSQVLEFHSSTPLDFDIGK